MSWSIGDLRREYMRQGLDETSLDPDPLKQFQTWFAEVVAAGLREPNAVVLATASSAGRPSARAVLLKGFDERGFVFFTNYESRKGHELAENPWAALLFLWVDLERQVRIEGRVEQTSPAESDVYYQSRPAGSRLGAWASPQSQVIASRQAIEERMQQLLAQYEGQEIPRPPHWGGYRLKPDSIEFWQGRANRLHDRLRYRLEHGAWIIERLSP